MSEQDKEQLLTTSGDVVKPGLYIGNASTLYKVSSVDGDLVKMIVCMEKGQLLNRTTVRTYHKRIVHGMPTGSKRAIAKYEEMASRGN
jgi:hypothetical protein